ncbi:hypothetical protein [Cellulomonas marina]|uniref:Uncharacterized protein n=1 Tax=Cellulomonas marina TaxID=988821 RepID=A0A1I1AQ48_9CELL|nr:hypothetical protein [Cellulomonas marina]GIG29292.1 hypothetical protein Cma02nite_18920 [Cellulomonas marina]SFB40151.1 hypothetical protein SAMN05421867_12131 [Cellulomonas marina]
MSARRALVLLAVVVVALVVVLSSRGHEQPQATGGEPSEALPAPFSPAPASSRPAPASGSTEPSPGHVPDQLEHDSHEHAHENLDEPVASSAPAPAVWDATVAAAATQAATAALEAFARPGSEVDAAAWWTRLEPLLSTAAAPIYASVDPRLVPYMQVQHVDPALRAESDLLAAVTATTDAGAYDVLLSREDGASHWRVERLRPLDAP